MTTFVQLSARLENFLRGWLLVLGLKEGLVECALKVWSYNCTTTILKKAAYLAKLAEGIMSGQEEAGLGPGL